MPGPLMAPGPAPQGRALRGLPRSPSHVLQRRFPNIVPFPTAFLTAARGITRGSKERDRWINGWQTKPQFMFGLLV